MHLYLQEGLLHANDGAVDVDELRAEADKVSIVLVDDLHKPVAQHLQMCFQLRTERLQRDLQHIELFYITLPVDCSAVKGGKYLYCTAGDAFISIAA